MVDVPVRVCKWRASGAKQASLQTLNGLIRACIVLPVLCERIRSQMCTWYGCVGRTTKSTLNVTKADAVILRANAIYQKENNEWLQMQLQLSGRTKICFHLKLEYLSLHIRNITLPWISLPTCTSNITINETAQHILSNYLSLCLRTPKVACFKIQMALLAMEESEGKKTRKKNIEALQWVQAMQ